MSKSKINLFKRSKILNLKSVLQDGTAEVLNSNKKAWSLHLLQPKDSHVTFTVNSKFSLGVSVSVNVLFHVSLCYPITDWQPCQVPLGNNPEQEVKHTVDSKTFV